MNRWARALPIFRCIGLVLGSALTLVLLCSDQAHAASGDPYLSYLREAPEYKTVVPLSPAVGDRWNRWLYMPWRYRWTIGTGEEATRFCRAQGINGGVMDHGQGPLAWLTRAGLPFYGGHMAGKGFLHLRRTDVKKLARDPRTIRQSDEGSQSLDAHNLQKVMKTIERNVEALRDSDLRVAYSLDDEISWGVKVKPLAWRLSSADGAYRTWLRSYYGEPTREPMWVGPDFALDQLDRQLQELDFSPFLDRLSYNDSVWANLIGHLVAHTNRLDPETPCGISGVQGPSLWGGYDFAKLLKKIQFIETYDVGSAPEIVRSLRTSERVPMVSTHFHSKGENAVKDRWFAWYRLAHGDSGMIGWVEDWFDGVAPRPWLQEFGSTLKEIGGIHGDKLIDARWIHDRVALYYSHPSIQVSWILDSEAHGRTWKNRNNDHRLGTSHNIRKAWEYLLTDSGIQYDFLAYDRVAIDGVPSDYQVVILPATFALSDIEADRLEEFVRNGGTLIADFGTGLFDQHGRGRSIGALDRVFGVRHDGTETASDLFGPRLWVETDQDKGYGFSDYQELLSTLETSTDTGFAIAERRLEVQHSRSLGKGRAVYLNLSPQRYLDYRQRGVVSGEHRLVFTRHLRAAGIRPRLVWKAADPVAGRDLEATYWCNNDRTFYFVFRNTAPPAEWRTEDSSTAAIPQVPLHLEFAVKTIDLLDERTGKRYPNATEFHLNLDPTSALFLSSAGCPIGFD